MPKKTKKTKKKRQSKRKPKTSTKLMKGTPRRKRAVKAKSAGKPPARKTAQKETASTRSRRKSGSVDTESEIRREIESRYATSAGTVSGRQSGDLEGLSREEQADSESVDELVEEGNLFEAGVVKGVEEADNADEREVHTHEVPEDDVPREYLDEE
jgi:hypothetical protein